MAKSDLFDEFVFIIIFCFLLSFYPLLLSVCSFRNNCGRIKRHVYTGRRSQAISQGKQIGIIHLDDHFHSGCTS